jgi:Na+/H+ antiporter NhaD/arsenite permease-like protein
VLASFMGTTGASMLLIRPLIRANDNRKHVAHVVVFFIFIVSNAGGSLTPLGDPPLFLGFLKGVDFFWTVKPHLPETLFLVGALLAIFYALDRWYYHRAKSVLPPTPRPTHPRFGFDGKVNFCCWAWWWGLVLMSGFWKSGVVFNIAGTEVGLPGIVRDVGLVVVTLLSLWLTPKGACETTSSAGGPMQEVAKLFAGIFLTIIPVIAMLKAGVNGPSAPSWRAVTRPDGRPTRPCTSGPRRAELVPGQRADLPGVLQHRRRRPGGADDHAGPTLAAISAGSVFMGANTYIGNAPNLMVKAIAEDRGVKMPSFFGYMAWSVRHPGAAVRRHDLHLVPLRAGCP